MKAPKVFSTITARSTDFPVDLEKKLQHYQEELQLYKTGYILTAEKGHIIQFYA